MACHGKSIAKQSEHRAGENICQWEAGENKAILSILRYRGIDPVSISFSQGSILHYSGLSITYNEVPISFS